uniref:serine C-palmitoyltransferase n=1 Tax=Echinococcus granulosus TaxID=6210 RepID=A0A068X116_ECHGR|nr:serine palmitoyltransferase long chain base [Echinococcus granulosus]
MVSSTKITKFAKPRTGESFYESFEEISLKNAVLTYMSFLILNLLGRLQDFLRKHGLLNDPAAKEKEVTRSFVPLYSDYEAFYTRNIYRRARDCWNRPICSTPGPEMVLMDRVSSDSCWTFEMTNTTTKVLNFGSYNYLGFAEPSGPCIEADVKSIEKYGLGVASSRLEVGTLAVHEELEKLVAEFVGQEAAIVFGMGFATNALNMPCIFDKNSCIISDELNHTSLILGCRLSGATIRRFKHNDMQDLERLLADAVVYGRPRSRRPFSRIFIIVEGIYSMEGSIAHMPEIIALKKKYKAYLYVDEAHSIGALGPRGRGVVDYFGLDPADIDIAMGTFTKSFGSAGGYLAGSARLIDYVRTQSYSSIYGGTMPAPVCQQIVTSMRIIMGRECPGEGERRLKQLAWNTRYFRAHLHQMGLIIFGNRDSPVIPIILYMPGKLVAFSRMCLERGLGVVIVGFPATGLLASRSRFCISAGHTKEMLDKALRVIAEVTDELHLRWSRLPPPYWTKVYIHGNRNGVQKNKASVLSLPNDHQTSENGDDVRPPLDAAPNGHNQCAMLFTQTLCVSRWCKFRTTKMQINLFKCWNSVREKKES